jgi:hypothetical protein
MFPTRFRAPSRAPRTGIRGTGLRGVAGQPLAVADLGPRGPRPTFRTCAHAVSPLHTL